MTTILHARTRLVGRGLAALSALVPAAVSCGGSDSTPTGFDPLAETSATVEAAVNQYASGQIFIPANCGAQTPINCPGGTAAAPAPVNMTGSTPQVQQVTPETFNFQVDVAFATPADIPITILGAPCGLAINTAAGASPTVQIAGSATFGSHTQGGAINQVTLAVQSLTGLEAADIDITGGVTCQVANLSVGLFVNTLTASLQTAALRLCGAPGPALFVACLRQET
jgi:hypothetical protein